MNLRRNGNLLRADNRHSCRTESSLKVSLSPFLQLLELVCIYVVFAFVNENIRVFDLYFH